MVRAPEAESPIGVITPTEASVDQPNWKLRKEPHDRLLASYREIPSPGYDLESLLFDTSTVTYSARVDRSVIASARVPWPLIDALWDRYYPNGDIPQSETVRKLIVKRSPFIASFENPDVGVRVLQYFNTQNKLFMTEIRGPDTDLVRSAKDELGQSKGKYTNSAGREYDSYHRTYDIYDRDNIERDEGISQSLIDFFKTLSDRGDLVYIHSSDDKFRADYPNYPAHMAWLESKPSSLKVV